MHGLIEKMTEANKSKLFSVKYDDGIECEMRPEIVFEVSSGETSSNTKLVLASDRQWLDLGMDFRADCDESSTWSGIPLYPTEASKMIAGYVHDYCWKETLVMKVVDLMERGLLQGDSQLWKGIERGEWSCVIRARALESTQLTTKLATMFLKTFCRLGEIEMNLRHYDYKDPLIDTLPLRNQRHFVSRMSELKEHWGVQSDQIYSLIDCLLYREPSTDTLATLHRLVSNLESAVWGDADPVTSRSNSIEPTSTASALAKKTPDAPSAPQANTNAAGSTVNNYENCTFATSTEYNFTANQTNSQFILHYVAAQAEKQSRECEPNSENGSQEANQHNNGVDQIPSELEPSQEPVTPVEPAVNATKRSGWFDLETQKLFCEIFLATYVKHFDSLSERRSSDLTLINQTRISSENASAITKLLFGKQAEFDLSGLSNRIEKSQWSNELKSFTAPPDLKDWQEKFRHLLIAAIYTQQELSRPGISKILKKFGITCSGDDNMRVALITFLKKFHFPQTVPFKKKGSKPYKKKGSKGNSTLLDEIMKELGD